MLKTSMAVIAAALFAVGLGVSGASAASSDTHTSTDNSKLSCTLDVVVQGGKITVTWTITGATKASIDPLTFKGGVPLKGSQTIDGSGPIVVFLVAQDGQGHSVRCTSDSGKPPLPPVPPPSAGGNGSPNNDS